MHKPIKKVLIANRGEIARRIITTCSARNIDTVAMYAPEDANAPYVFAATNAYPLSQNGSLAYLYGEEIVQIALKAKADAIHPGYGFLSEQASFAQQVHDAGLTWLGPTPETIAAMGNKASARKLMKKSGVPTLPGITLRDEKESPSDIGYPLLIKAALGGGGKAMRLVHTASNLQNALSRVRSEAKQLYGSSELIVEKYLTSARHIEVQIAGDGRNYIHLFERECSLQRRHQKVVEEAPCSFISQSLREKLYKAALNAAKAVSYIGVGTVEFLVTPQEDFYFLEMNTRLQVEHTVTELITGIDLVGLQIDIAQSGTLSFSQDEITTQGHAIQARIYAEDPENNFLPNTGRIALLSLPNGPFIRHDHDLEEGQEVTPHFDPMLSKLCTFGKTRAQAIKQLHSALSQFGIAGVKTNISFLEALITTPNFAHGTFDTSWLEKQKIKPLALKAHPPIKQEMPEENSKTPSPWKVRSWQ